MTYSNKLLIVVTHDGTESYLCGLADACIRKGVDYYMFFTGAGVKVLSAQEVVERANNAVEAIACEHAWEKEMADDSCPISIGSQTNHSEMLTVASKVVSL